MHSGGQKRPYKIFLKSFLLFRSSSFRKEAICQGIRSATAPRTLQSIVRVVDANVSRPFLSQTLAVNQWLQLTAMQSETDVMKHKYIYLSITYLIRSLFAWDYMTFWRLEFVYLSVQSTPWLPAVICSRALTAKNVRAPKPRYAYQLSYAPQNIVVLDRRHKMYYSEIPARVKKWNFVPIRVSGAKNAVLKKQDASRNLWLTT